MAIKIKGTPVIGNDRKLTNIADGSGELSLSGDTLSLSIGGTTQDTQSLQSLTVNEALKLTTARTISLTGDLTGSTTFDGSGNVSINANTSGFYALRGFGKCATNPTQCYGSGVTHNGNAYPYCCDCNSGNKFTSNELTLCTD